MPLTGDPVAHGDVVDVGAHLDDLAEELVPDRHRHLHRRARPLVPLLEVQVGAAQAGPQHPDLDVLVAAPRLGDVDELETGTCRDLPRRAHGPIMPGCRADRCRAATARTARRAARPTSAQCHPPHTAPPTRPPRRPHGATAPRGAPTLDPIRAARPDTDPGGDP